SRAYREAVPHYPLASADGPIYQAFTVGRVRFLLTDSRSARSAGTTPGGRDAAACAVGRVRSLLTDSRSARSAGSTLGARQRAWLEAELRSGRDRYALVDWVSSIPWIDAPDPGADPRGGFAAEGGGLADLVASAGIRNLLMVSGDAHMLAI